MTPPHYLTLAHLGFWGDGGVSCDQGGDEGSEEGFSASSGVVDELEEAEVEGQLLLRDAAVGAQPGAQQRPEAFQGIDMDLAEAVPIVIAGILTPGMADRFVTIAPVLQAGIDVVFVGLDQGARADGVADDRLDSRLLNVGQHSENDFAPALDQSQDRRLLLVQGAATAFTFQSPPASFPTFFERRPGFPCGRPPRRPRQPPPHRRAGRRAGARPAPDGAGWSWPGHRPR